MLKMGPEIPPSLILHPHLLTPNNPNQTQTSTMSEPVDRLALTQRVWGDSRSGRYYTLPEGEPIGAARLLCSAPRLTPNPEPSPGTSDTADRYFKEDPLPLEVKDTHLQLYYVHMQWALRTCHPMLLGDEVSNLMDTLEVEGDHAESSIPRLAKILAQAGYQKIEYSRSCALVAYEIHRRVRSISPAASELFVRSLVCAVTEVFRGYYFEVPACASQSIFILTNRWSEKPLAPQWTRWNDWARRIGDG